MRKIDFFAALLLCSLSHAQSPADTAPVEAKISAPSQQLTPAQKEVWAAEESMHRFEQQRDTKRFLSLWDENFVGWPDYEPRPVRKPKIEKDTVEEFQTPQAGPPLPAPKPEAIGISGNIAITHYFWPEADQTSPIVYRTTHTWQKGPQGWRIIGGMACEVPRSDPTKTMIAQPSPPSPLEEERAVEATVRAYEKAIQEYDFPKADTFLAPNAKWIERSLPESAAYDGTGFFVDAKAARVRLTNEPHDFHTQIQGSVAWVTLLVDVTTIADNAAAGSLLARTEAEETGKMSDPNQGTWRASYVESEVLVRTPDGWKISMAHTSRLPAK
jgi:ketosteroid isomerase-like protein